MGEAGGLARGTLLVGVGVGLCMAATAADLHAADLHAADLHAADLDAADLDAADLHAADRYSAGLRMISARSGTDRVPIALTYPAVGAERETRFGPFTLKVALNAAPAKGRFGVIVLSHGAGGGNLNHRTTALALSRAGWIVAAVEHPGGNWRDGSRIGTHADFAGRPRHLRAALDRVLTDPRFEEAADASRVGAVGYSMGGYTVLAAIGGRPDAARLTRHCAENSKEDRSFCGYREGAKPLARVAVEPDRRIRAAVALAPVGAIFGPGAFDRVTATILLVRAGKDGELAYPFHAHHVNALLNRDADYRVIPGIGHFTFIAPFPDAIRAQVGRVAQDPPGVDRRAFHVNLNRVIAKFFAEALK